MDYEKILEKAIEFCTSAGIKLVLAVIILLVGFKLIKVLTKAIAGHNAPHMDKSLKSFFISFLNIALKIILAITVAGYIGVPMTSVITVLGSAGLALGLSLQGSLANLAGGIIIMVFKPFSVGDYVVSGSLEGTVTDIGIFYTKLVTGDNRIVVIPNGTISNQSVVNVSSKPDRRVDLKFTASYDADINAVKAALIKVAEENGKILKDPAPFAAVSAHLDSAIEYLLRVWCKKEDYWNVYFALMEDVKREFDAQNIEIPYPNVDVNTKNS